MNLTTTQTKLPQCTVIAIAGKIVGTGAVELETALHQAIADGESRLVLDLAESPIISSAGLRVIISAAKRLRAIPSGDLRLAGASQQMQDVLELAGLLTVFKVYPSQEEAVRSFQAVL